MGYTHRIRARPAMVRRGAPCAHGARRAPHGRGARAARPCSAFSLPTIPRATPCKAVLPRLAPRRPSSGGRASSYQGHYRMHGGGVKEHAGRAPRASAPAAAARRHGQDPRPRLVPLQSWGAPVYPTIALVSVVGLRLTSHGKLTDTKVSLVSS